MPSTAEVTVRVADLEPVKAVLAAATDLAAAVELYLGPLSRRETLEGLLREALRDFRATVKAQTDA